MRIGFQAKKKSGLGWMNMNNRVVRIIASLCC